MRSKELHKIGEKLGEGLSTPEYRRMTPPPEMPKVELPQPSALITITVAEYHFLTKAATLLEAVMNCDSYHRDGLVEAARKTLGIEAGAAE